MKLSFIPLYMYIEEKCYLHQISVVGHHLCVLVMEPRSIHILNKKL